LATAVGDIFQNPFREPGSTDVISARVMDGGLVTEPFELIVQLDAPSHARARQIASAINSRFPADQQGQVARGVSDAAVALRVPAEWADRPDAFLEIVNHTPIDWQYRKEYARRCVEAMRDDPTLARDLSWCLVACNEVEFIRELYDSADIAVLLAALQAGAELADPLAGEPLRDLGTRGPLGVRAEAIRLLGFVPGGATVDLFLREQAASADFVVRAAAYESLARRAELMQMSGRLAAAGNGVRHSLPSTLQLREEARVFLPGSGLQGIARRPVMGQLGAEPVLTLDWAPFGSPLVYVTMHGQPKVVLFGEDVSLKAPLTLTTWNNRLMIISEPNTNEFRLYFQHPGSGRATAWSFNGDVSELIAFLARHPVDGEDRPGLALSYSEVVNLLAELHKAGALGADFTTERDRLAGQILAATQATQADQRPETPDDVPEAPLLPGQRPDGFKPEVVPLNQPEPEQPR
jgi:hypothetical protein